MKQRLVIADSEEKAVSVRLNHYRPEGSQSAPSVSAFLWLSDNFFCGRFNTSHEQIRAVRAAQTTIGPGPEVWKDSCCEVFLFHEQSASYINLEMNANGAVFGAHMKFPRITLETLEDFRRVQVHSDWTGVGDSWTLTFAVDLQLYAHYFGFRVEEWSAQHFKIGLFKCGDETPSPHWISLTPMRRLDFHDPDCFAVCVFDLPDALSGLPLELLERIYLKLGLADRLALRKVSRVMSGLLDQQLETFLWTAQTLVLIAQTLDIERLPVMFPFVSWKLDSPMLDQRMDARTIYSILSRMSAKEVTTRLGTRAKSRTGQVVVTHWDEATVLGARNALPRFLPAFGFPTDQCLLILDRFVTSHARARAFCGDTGWAFLADRSLILFGLINLNEWHVTMPP